MGHVAWTDEVIKELKRLVAKKLSAQQIATKLDCGASRNAVIGKAHRLGLKLAPQAKRPRRAVLPAAPEATQQPAAPAGETPDEIPPHAPGLPCRLADLALGMCRYPYGDRPPYTFCGQRVWAEGSSWCAEHARIVYQCGAPGWRSDRNKQ